MVLRDRRSGNNPGTNYGTSTSGLDERLYVAQDADWNTTGLITMSGTMPEGFADAPYGNNLLTTTGTTDIYNWVYFHQGGRLDTTSGLYLFRHRDYAPGSWGNNPYVMGRWMEEDPWDYFDQLNRYQCENDDPLVSVDSMGTCTCPSFFGPTLTLTPCTTPGATTIRLDFGIGCVPAPGDGFLKRCLCAKIPSCVNVYHYRCAAFPGRGPVWLLVKTTSSCP
jgi:RHS repeat-associated protein